ncbi:MAG TPA: helix-turn-helix domain-containing protein [Gelria sp.]|nr:helix-turn-helix domain-containing protein [Gelria sp.]
MEFLGMDQEELAARLGITSKHLSNILNANAPITYETALKPVAVNA